MDLNPSGPPQVGGRYRATILWATLSLLVVGLGVGLSIWIGLPAPSASLSTAPRLPWPGEPLAAMPGVHANYPIECTLEEWSWELSTAAEWFFFGVVLAAALLALRLPRRSRSFVDPLALVASCCAFGAMLVVGHVSFAHGSAGNWLTPPYASWRGSPSGSGAALSLVALACLVSLVAVVRGVRRSSLSSVTLSALSLLGAFWIGVLFDSVVLRQGLNLFPPESRPADLPASANGEDPRDFWFHSLIVECDSDRRCRLLVRPDSRDAYLPPHVEWSGELDPEALARAVERFIEETSPGFRPLPHWAENESEDEFVVSLSISSQVEFGEVRPFLVRLLESGHSFVRIVTAPRVERGLVRRLTWYLDLGPEHPLPETRLTLVAPETPAGVAGALFDGKRYEHAGAVIEARAIPVGEFHHGHVEDGVRWSDFVHAFDTLRSRVRFQP